MCLASRVRRQLPIVWEAVESSKTIWLKVRRVCAIPGCAFHDLSSCCSDASCTMSIPHSKWSFECNCDAVRQKQVLLWREDSKWNPSEWWAFPTRAAVSSLLTAVMTNDYDERYIGYSIALELSVCWGHTTHMQGPGGVRNSAALRSEPELQHLNGRGEQAIESRKALVRQTDRLRLLSQLLTAPSSHGEYIQGHQLPWLCEELSEWVQRQAESDQHATADAAKNVQMRTSALIARWDEEQRARLHTWECSAAAAEMRALEADAREGLLMARASVERAKAAEARASTEAERNAAAERVTSAECVTSAVEASTHSQRLVALNREKSSALLLGEPTLLTQERYTLALLRTLVDDAPSLYVLGSKDFAQLIECGPCGDKRFLPCGRACNAFSEGLQGLLETYLVNWIMELASKRECQAAFPNFSECSVSYSASAAPDDSCEPPRRRRRWELSGDQDADEIWCEFLGSLQASDGDESVGSRV